MVLFAFIPKYRIVLQGVGLKSLIPSRNTATHPGNIFFVTLSKAVIDIRQIWYVIDIKPQAEN